MLILAVSYEQHYSLTSAHWIFVKLTNFYFCFRQVKLKIVKIFMVSSMIYALEFFRSSWFDFYFHFLSFKNVKKLVIQVNLVGYYKMVFSFEFTLVVYLCWCDVHSFWLPLTCADILCSIFLIYLESLCLSWMTFTEKVISCESFVQSQLHDLCTLQPELKF